MLPRHQSSFQTLSVQLRTMDRIRLMAIGIGFIFAALGAGEAVYRLAFLPVRRCN